jgi:hypothetical protein
MTEHDSTADRKAEPNTTNSYGFTAKEFFEHMIHFFGRKPCAVVADGNHGPVSFSMRGDGNGGASRRVLYGVFQDIHKDQLN